ncbi:MAG: hypothetical protein P1V51_11765 [Deltaproteobacteria bacterium]|nr:hypothetical protein [Deltaproteobacteria bacterium]
MSPLYQAWTELEGGHRKIRLLFNVLEAAEDQLSALTALWHLQTELEKHFRQEEGPGGLYESLGLHLRGARAVLADHERLRDAIATVAEAIESLDRPRSPLIHAATLELGNELRGHERREHALVKRALSDLSGAAGQPAG